MTEICYEANQCCSRFHQCKIVMSPSIQVYISIRIDLCEFKAFLNAKCTKKRTETKLCDSAQKTGCITVHILIKLTICCLFNYLTSDKFNEYICFQIKCISLSTSTLPSGH